MSVIEACAACWIGGLIGVASGSSAAWTVHEAAGRGRRRVATALRRVLGGLPLVAVLAAVLLASADLRLGAALAGVSMAVMHRQASRGGRSVDAALLAMAREHGLAGWRLWWHVVRPAAAAAWLTGVLAALVLCSALLLLAGASLPGLGRWLDPAAAPPATVLGFGLLAAAATLGIVQWRRRGPRWLRAGAVAQPQDGPAW